jgi:hypothetical protein
MWNHWLIEGYVNYLATPSLHTPELDEYYRRLVYYDGDGVLAAQTGTLSPELCTRWDKLQDVAREIRDRQKDLYQGNPPKCPPYQAKGEPVGEPLHGAKSNEGDTTAKPTGGKSKATAKKRGAK